MAQFVHEPAREIPVRASVDVLVVGGGPAGLMAAQAASGKGLDVMLIENLDDERIIALDDMPGWGNVVADTSSEGAKIGRAHV